MAEVLETRSLSDQIGRLAGHPGARRICIALALLASFAAGWETGSSWAAVYAIPVVLAEPEEPAEPVLVHLQEAKAGVQAGVQMVTDSTQRAVNLFAQEFPNLKGRNRP